MPVKPPRICACGKVVPALSLCECGAADRRARKARFDAKRGTSSQRGYTGAWDKAREGFLAKHPFCRRCGDPAEVVDHITPHRGDKAVFWDRANWQPLCTPCHSGTKQREERRKD